MMMVNGANGINNPCKLKKNVMKLNIVDEIIFEYL